MRSAIILVLSLSACTVLAQSLGEVARETRNAPHTRAKTVVTNDEIPSVDTMSTAAKANTADDKTSVKGESKADGEKAADAKGSTDSELAKKDEEQKKLEAEWNSKFSAQREKISLQERELKVSEQEFQQKQVAHIADVNARVNNQQQYAEAEKLDQEDLDQKKEKLKTEREKLNSMQEDARHAGVKLPD